ncbi:unnamed protein product [Rotaria magnacalcarata]|uniref:F-box domain-containing protein n=2 Tax=Rotaria magnacalcarata TaxID=392030 RepID=A0A816X6A2_9BILA|nr:unnamed protein product [Rotaria magnacalcarata]
MNDSTVNILSLFDEILLVIYNKLDNMDVLYSLIGVNRKLDRLARDITFTQSVDLFTILSNESNDSRNKSILDRFCFDILPQIQHNIESLTLDSLLIDRVFRIGNYSKLHKLTFLNLQFEMASRLFNDKSSFIHIFQNQISHFTVMMHDDSKGEYIKELFTNVFTNILIIFANLIYLNFHSQDICRYISKPFLSLPSTTCYSSNIVHLNIGVFSFDDCLCLLDGHLTQLHTFIVKVEHIIDTSMTIKNTKAVSNLKCFSLTSFHRTNEYDNQILPLLHQMLQLEELTLSLIVDNRTSFIDGTHLINNILNRMSYLQTFIFNIITEYVTMDEERLPTLDDIEQPLIQRGFNVNCYTDYNEFYKGQCHIYSLPYTIDCMHIHSSLFYGDLFRTVRYLYVQDFVRSFEDDFFVRIAQAFPLLNKLTIFNKHKQAKLKQQQDNHESTYAINEFSHLMILNVAMSCIDYAKQFLFDFNTRLPCLNRLHIKYRDLVIVTENFTNNDARVNCSKLQHIIFDSIPTIYPENFYLYFPLL